MALPLLLLAWTLAAAPAWADPLKSPACAQALAQLDAARQGRSGSAERLRAEAASLCLGLQAPAEPRAPRWAQPPLVVPPPVVEPASQPTLPVSPSLPSAPVDIGRPATITSCDAHGCWASDGTRLQRVGPPLLGPGGVCALQGPFAYCP